MRLPAATAVVRGTLLLAAWPSRVLVQSLCYFPNRNLSPDDAPCQDGKPHSTCCRVGEVCLSNQLCMRTDGTDVRYSRGTCTDQEWQDSSCPKFCSDAKFDAVDTGQIMVSCANNNSLFYCLHANSDESSCAKSELLVRLEASPTVIKTVRATSTTSVSVTTSVASPSTVSSSTVSSSPSSSRTSAPNGADREPSSSDNLSSGAKIGMGVGIGVGASALLVAVVACLVMLRQRRAAAAGGAPPPGEAGWARSGASPDAAKTATHEAPNSPLAARSRFELAGS